MVINHDLSLKWIVSSDSYTPPLRYLGCLHRITRITLLDINYWIYHLIWENLSQTYTSFPKEIQISIGIDLWKERFQQDASYSGLNQFPSSNKNKLFLQINLNLNVITISWNQLSKSFFQKILFEIHLNFIEKHQLILNT